LNPVLAPEGEFISFARPKETNQRKGRPARDLPRYAILLRLQAGANHPWFARSPVGSPLALLAFDGGRTKGLLPLARRDASLHRPFGLFPPKAAVLSATERDFRSKQQSAGIYPLRFT